MSVVAARRRALALWYRRDLRLAVTLPLIAGAAAAILPAGSSTTLVGAPQVIAFAVVLSVPVALVAATYIGASLGGLEAEMDVLREHHLSGAWVRGLMAERLFGTVVLAGGVCLGVVCAAALVALGQSLVQAVAPSGATPLAHGATAAMVTSAVIATLFSGVAAFTLAFVSRSRLVGLVGWAGLLLVYLMSIGFFMQSGVALVVERWLPFGFVLGAVPGVASLLPREVDNGLLQGTLTVLLWTTACGVSVFTLSARWSRR